MADIELVIKIPEGLKKDCDAIKDLNDIVGDMTIPYVFEAIRNGTPLPKGHGRLKDIDKIEALLELNKADNEIAKALKNIIESVSTIIDADKESEELGYN